MCKCACVYVALPTLHAQSSVNSFVRFLFAFSFFCCCYDGTFVGIHPKSSLQKSTQKYGYLTEVSVADQVYTPINITLTHSHAQTQKESLLPARKFCQPTQKKLSFVQRWVHTKKPAAKISTKIIIKSVRVRIPFAFANSLYSAVISTVSTPCCQN